MTTASLFDAACPSPAYQRHSATSKAAAEAIQPVAGTLRQRVLDAIKVSGSAGLTDEEICDRLHLNPSSARPRRIELWHAGLVVENGRRKTASGRMACVWVAT